MAPTRLIARSDAMYCGVAMAVTILELALVATNPHLGAHALEITLILQLIISASLEFYTGATLSAYIGIVKTMQAGFIFKLASALAFLIAFYLSYHDRFIATWCLLILAFCLDASGTGCLKSTFRPAYNILHLTRCGESADYAKIACSCLNYRILLPFTLLLCASILLSFWPPLTASIVIFSSIILCRVAQVYYAFADLNTLAAPPHTKSLMGTFSFARLLNAYTRNPTAFCGYLTGNLFESIILMYTIGLLYRHKNLLNLPAYLAWLGSSLISFLLYITSIIVGGGLLVYLLKDPPPKSVAFIFLTVTLTSSLWLAFDINGQTLFYALTTFSISGVIIGLVLIRLSTNAILKTANDLEAVAFFLTAEIVTTLFIVIIAAIGALMFGPDGLIKGFGFGVTVMMLIYFWRLYRVKKSDDTVSTDEP